MAFKLDDDADAFSDINVTPLVDVMLVLLVIFMVTAPLLHQGVEVQLPEVRRAEPPEVARPPHPLDHQERELLPERDAHSEVAAQGEAAAHPGRRDKAVYLKADRNLAYGVVVETMDTLNRLGVESLGMVTELKSEGTP